MAENKKKSVWEAYRFSIIFFSYTKITFCLSILFKIEYTSHDIPMIPDNKVVNP